MLSRFICHATLQQQKLSAIARNTQCHSGFIDDDAAVSLQSLLMGVLSIPLIIHAYIGCCIRAGLPFMTASQSRITFALPYQIVKI